jgi:hypothetical protein
MLGPCLFRRLLVVASELPDKADVISDMGHHRMENHRRHETLPEIRGDRHPFAVFENSPVHGELQKLAQSGGFDALIPSPECATPSS